VQQQVNMQIQHIDTEQRFIDIGLSNDACELTALSFQINGIRASAVMSLLPPGSPAVSFFHHVNGKIMMVVQDLTNSINRASNLRPAIRVFYSATTDSLIYLKNADAAVNEVYERVSFVDDSSQFAVRMTTLSVNNLHQRPTFSVFPNPSNGIFQLQGVADSEPINLRLYDALGRLVFVQESVDFRQGQIQIIYNSKNHYSLRGFYGLSTTYERFQENCKHPKNLKSLVEIIDNYKYHFDFICYNEKNRWLLFVRFDKTNGKLISSDELDYFTCSNLNYNYVIRELVSKFGDGTTPIKYGASSERNFQDRLKNYEYQVNRHNKDWNIDLKIKEIKRSDEDISASKVRQSALDNDFKTFKSLTSNLDQKDFEWYLDIRRYGSVPSSGFGLGLERAVTWICGLPHVRETGAFPRLYGRAYP
jgi:uncharacterized protein (DUF2141 family)